MICLRIDLSRLTKFQTNGNAITAIDLETDCRLLDLYEFPFLVCKSLTDRELNVNLSRHRFNEFLRNIRTVRLASQCDCSVRSRVVRRGASVIQSMKEKVIADT